MVHASGKVNQLYPDRNGCYIRITYSGDQPKDSLFVLKKSHENFNALYSLAVVAAVNGYVLTIRTVTDIVSTQHGEVEYLVVNW